MNRNKGVQRLSVFIMVLALTILACQGASGLNPFATSTPTPTATFTPTITPSPTPTFTPTSTPPPTGRSRQEQPDGTTLFTDYDAGCQLTFPQGWTVVVFDKEDIDQLIDSVQTDQQNVSEMIDILKKTDVNNMIRVVGYNFKAQQGRYTPNISISYDTNALYGVLPLKDLVDSTAKYLSSLNITIVNSEIKETAAGVEVGVLEAKWSVTTTDNQKINLAQKQVFFKSGKGIVIITFSTVQDATVDLTPDLEKLIETIQFLD